MDNKDVALYQAALAKYSTSHLLHLVLSILTGGGWLIVWLLVGMSNRDARTKVHRALNAGLPYKPPGVSGIVLFLVFLLVLIFVLAAMSAA